MPQVNFYDFNGFALHMKNKMQNNRENGREELQNDVSNEILPIHCKITKFEKSKNTKLLHLKAQLSLSYKPILNHCNKIDFLKEINFTTKIKKG